MLMCQSFLTYVAILTFPCGAEIISKDPRRPLKASPDTTEARPLEKQEEPGAPWPMPKLWQPTDKLMTLDTSRFFLVTSVRSCDIITDALHRYRALIRSTADRNARPADGLPVLDSLEVKVANYEIRDCSYPYEDADESYVIDITKGNKVLKANTTWGVLRGLETFTHLIYTDEEGLTCFINETYIEDSPRYTFRSILIDTARHFLPTWLIKQNLDAMSYNKFNVLHWHIVDDQSWPLQLKSFPNMTDIGAFTKHHVYTQEDVKDIIEYARLRGIRVIPEIDAPGHTQALGSVLPSILTACYGKGVRGTALYGEYSAHDILDPMNNSTYDVMATIYAEVQRIFKDEYIHLGMDEVYPECWKSSLEVDRFLKANQLGNITEFEQYYIHRTLRNVMTLKYKSIIWEDPVTNGANVDQNTLVTVWKSTVYPESWYGSARLVTDKGYRIIVAACWYLDLISYGEDWKTYYECNPAGFARSEKSKDLVVGGEACLWGEYVDETNFISTLWPRASAVAERLWSPENMTNAWEAKFRLDRHRCRMVQRGLSAQPILCGYCRNYQSNLYARQQGRQRHPYDFAGLHECRSLLLCGLLLVLGCAWITRRHFSVLPMVLRCTRWIVTPAPKGKTCYS
ncbi:beta-hexosaminidase subunit beta-like [Ornithodoros turicata]|uniref:beta-hexosaminidase subunit beta-like n=1 Tax=Ornithodoros turicata TaxID=34597 RepID=UPI003139D2A7